MDSQSFDITTGCDLQEVDNAVNQTRKELSQRYDFRHVAFSVSLEREKKELRLEAPDTYKLDAIYDVLAQKLIKRQVPVKNVVAPESDETHHSCARRAYKLTMGIETDTAKKIVKFVKELRLKKVQGSILEDKVRVASPSRDELQKAMAALRSEDFGVALAFNNYR